MLETHLLLYRPPFVTSFSLKLLLTIPGDGTQHVINLIRAGKELDVLLRINFVKRFTDELRLSYLSTDSISSSLGHILD